MTRKLPAVILILLLSALSSFGQGFWLKKPYTQWSEKEAKSLLNESPWSWRLDISQNSMYLTDQTASTDFGSVSQGADRRSQRLSDEQSSNMKVTYIVQLRSAQPVREAIARQAELRPETGKLTPEQRQQLEAQLQKIVAAKYPEVVLVHVDYSANTSMNQRKLDEFWQKQTGDTTRGSLYLISGKGKRVPLINLLPQGPGRGFDILYPRNFEGQPVLTPEDKSLRLEMVHPNNVALRGRTMLVEFKVSKMMMNGELIY